MKRPSSYLQLTQQIADLQAKAAKAKTSEIAGVVARIREAVKVYGLTAADIFPSVDSQASRAKGAPPKVAKAPKRETSKYSDGAGNSWGGRGPKPRWLKDGLGSGKKLADFLVDAAEEASASTPKVDSVKTSKKPKRKLPTKYRDAVTGNVWTGRGLQPLWTRAALAAGKSLNDFLVPVSGKAQQH